MDIADFSFPGVGEFSAYLRQLRMRRLAAKSATSSSRTRFTPAQRARILERTNGHCHICGGEIEGAWVVDHVRAHVYGVAAESWNHLAAHVTCNRSKWFYGAEEFQWILKMGVFFRTQFEEAGDPDASALAAAFLRHETKRRARRKAAD